MTRGIIRSGDDTNRTYYHPKQPQKNKRKEFCKAKGEVRVLNKKKWILKPDVIQKSNGRKLVELILRQKKARSLKKSKILYLEMWLLISFVFILDYDTPPRLWGHRFSNGENQFCVSAAHAFSKGPTLGGDHNSVCTRKCIWYITHLSFQCEFPIFVSHKPCRQNFLPEYQRIWSRLTLWNFNLYRSESETGNTNLLELFLFAVLGINPGPHEWAILLSYTCS